MTASQGGLFLAAALLGASRCAGESIACPKDFVEQQAERRNFDIVDGDGYKALI